MGRAVRISLLVLLIFGLTLTIACASPEPSTLVANAIPTPLPAIPAESQSPPGVVREGKPIPVYGYKILKKYPHDKGAYTQGLMFEKEVMYEGTGLFGQSSLRKVDLETGTIIKMRELPSNYFGEGITVFGDTIIQLTWQSHVGFVYAKNSFEMLRDFAYPTEGWGITNDGKRLIMSDGTAALYFMNPRTFNVTGSITVHDNDTPLTNLNELEYINGKIYANVWMSNKIAVIDPEDGKVTGWIDLSGILQPQDYDAIVDVLNGIAYDRVSKRLFVTGKLWPWLFEIEIIRR